MDPFSSAYTVSPAFIMQVMLMDEAGETPLRYIKGHQVAAMAGALVSPLHTLRDTTGTQGAFFVFSDISVRMEGSFRLRFELYEMEGNVESTMLSKLFADQGLRIRIRTEAGTKKRGKKSLACENLGPPAAKRAKRPDSNTQQNFAAGRTVFTRLGASASGSPPVAPLTRGLLTNAATNGASNPGLLIFHHDPFAVYRSDNESMTADTQRQCYQPKSMFELDDGYYHKQLSDTHSSPIYDVKTHRNTLDLSDMAAVALLDSLSGGNSHCFGNAAKHVSPPTVSNVDLSRLLSPTSNASLQQHQQHSQNTYAPMPASTGFSMGAPYSNYRVTSTRVSGYPDDQFAASVTACGAQNAFYPQVSFMSTATRLCPPLRSSAGTASANGILLPHMSQRLYNSQVRTASSGGSSSSDSCIGLDLTFSQPTQGNIMQPIGRQEEAWSGAFA
ncbi:hypothetical protein GGF42_006175 [Coemansia sp. RSA 2424]|nr:hypothetical protein GGF42_006175 [Coemansia sp. RSA 2424]